MPRQFKLKVGNHREGGRTYNKGEVVSSDLDLIKMFPGKFDAVEGSALGDTTQLAGTRVKDTTSTKKALDPESPIVNPGHPKDLATVKETPADKWGDEDEDEDEDEGAGEHKAAKPKKTAK